MSRGKLSMMKIAWLQKIKGDKSAAGGHNLHAAFERVGACMQRLGACMQLAAVDRTVPPARQL
jgi:hypothetical protein